MALTVTEQSLFSNLKQTLVMSRTETTKLNDTYEGMAKLEQLGLAIPEELKRFTVILNWPRTVVDSVEQRLDVQGFRMNGAANDYLWDVWQYNNMDERQTFAHVDALALARSYVCVGTNEQDRDYPLVTVESPANMVAVRDTRTHRITAALRLYSSNPEIPIEDDRATLYLPNQTRWLRLSNGQWEDEFEPDLHNLGFAPVVALVNRHRATRRRGSILEGVSEMTDVMPVADSASRAVTNTQLLQETLVAPARGVLGATKGDFVDADGNPLSTWQAYFGAIWAMGSTEAKTFQFDAADMTNIETIVNMYARQASGLTGLPIEYFGLNAQQPPSADGQRAGETRLIKRAERKQTGFGHSWESVQRLILRFKTGSWDQAATRMETIWRDAGTPTIAQVTDAIVKRYQTGLIDWETAQERLGESPEAIDQMRTRRQAEQAAALSFGVQQALNNDSAA